MKKKVSMCSHFPKAEVGRLDIGLSYHGRPAAEERHLLASQSKSPEPCSSVNTEWPRLQKTLIMSRFLPPSDITGGPCFSRMSVAMHVGVPWALTEFRGCPLPGITMEEDPDSVLHILFEEFAQLWW